jgi:AcrR family transcriptional regulator
MPRTQDNATPPAAAPRRRSRATAPAALQPAPQISPSDSEVSDRTPPKRGRPSARGKILDATLALVQEIGVPAITLEAVAERAGVSKGGLLYHFPFKEELMRAANEYLIGRRIQARQAVYAELAPHPNRALKAYVLASVTNRAGNDAISTRLLSAGSMQDASSEPIKRYFAERFPPFVDDVGFELAALAHAATEGLWFMEMHGVSPFTKKQREALVATIVSIVDGAPFVSPIAPPLPQAARSARPRAATAAPKAGRRAQK